MGQVISVESQVIGDVAVFDTNRSITGQDGVSYAGAEEVAAGDDYPAQLAGRLFEADSAIGHIFINSNTASVRRTSGWDDAALGTVAEVISNFFVFYVDGDLPADEPGEE